jgi:hypothetical protein
MAKKPTTESVFARLKADAAKLSRYDRNRLNLRIANDPDFQPNRKRTGPKSIRKARVIARIDELRDVDFGFLVFDWKGPNGIVAIINREFGTTFTPATLRTYYYKRARR